MCMGNMLHTYVLVDSVHVTGTLHSLQVCTMTRQILLPNLCTTLIQQIQILE